MKALAYTWFTIAAIFAALGLRATLAGDAPSVSVWLLAGIPAGIGAVFLVLAPRFHSTVPAPIRVVAFLTGIIVLYAGMGWALFVDEYSGQNFEMTRTGETAQVYTIDEAAQQRSLVFEGPVDEAEAYIAINNESGQSRTLPYVTAGIGAIVTLGSLGLGWKRNEDSETDRVPHQAHSE